MVKLGLVGRTLGHSFSRGYFTEKFTSLQLTGSYSYDNYELERIDQLPAVLRGSPDLLGLNVTIPYKQSVVGLLDELHGAASDLRTVNTVVRRENGSLHGYNTDVLGFRATLDSFGESLPRAAAAIVLGTGGASAAVGHVLAALDLPYRSVSRAPGPGQLDYVALANEATTEPRLWINTTPVGTAPNIEQLPAVPIEVLGRGHVVIDLIYNPNETRLLREARLRGAATANGLLMLHRQAEAAWELWQAELIARGV